ncbi:uncharacterized protein LOC110984459 [Acanthaster planci]|uniref:Uncharacterized protein LOC110984459 n=1 Tax=Acanthaster planci TaxID=133434 RepID=A0A8B7Z5Y3_ACAPL|nr:uncharacterized protein LOC110984459 [Acanthaster planci]
MNRLLLACALLAVVIASVKADCSPGYTQRIAVDKLWSTSHESWLFADHFCTVEGARLANIRNDADSIWINDFFLKNKRYLCGSGTGLEATILSGRGVDMGGRWQPNDLFQQGKQPASKFP